MNGTATERRVPWRGRVARHMGVLGTALLLALASSPHLVRGEEPLPAVPAAQPADELPPVEPSAGALQRARDAAQEAARIAEEIFRSQSITLGLGYGVGNFSRSRDDQFPDGSNQVVALSDSGTLLPFLAYNSPERLFAHEVYPSGGFLGVGGIAFGMNIAVNVATFRANRELAAKSELQTGQVVGGSSESHVSGAYAMAAPVLFLRLGPLFSPASETYLRWGYGAGVALTEFDADLRYRHAGYPAVRERFHHSPEGFDSAITDFLELRVGRWTALASEFGIEGRTKNGTYHVGNLSLSGGYSFTF